MGLSNDERGWVMTCLSGIACVLGASIICVDILVRQFPGKKDFRIQDSDSFLSVSLSLSFGVMLFSALYSMLPSAKRSLQEGGFTPRQSAWILIACFIGGVIGIQVVSRILHHFMPSHVVDCEHSHDEDAPQTNRHAHPNGHTHGHSHVPEPRPQQNRPRKSSLPGHMHRADSDRPSSRRSSYFGPVASAPYAPTAETEALSPAVNRPKTQQGAMRRPSPQQRLSSTFTQLTSGKTSKSDCNGPCYGFSEPCGPDFFKNVNARGGHRAPARMVSSQSVRPPMSKSATATSVLPPTESTPLLHNSAEEPRSQPLSRHVSDTAMESARGNADLEHGPSESSDSIVNGGGDGVEDLHKTHTNETTSSHNPDHHHHHVPTNAFLSIGLQTSIAIALHKLPEGFITYATNHANPKLGVSVFLALFIHNITEGFAMALPLYLALQSRITAMTASFVLGGLSQPIGAGIAALWFKVADWKGDKWAPSEGVYGGMFAVTAGIMASVALQLFSESLDLTHSRTLCMVGAFTGMTVLGISSALTA